MSIFDVEIEPGQTFFYPTEARDTYLWMVLNEPDEQGMVPIVRLLRNNDMRDDTVVLDSEDHDYFDEDHAVIFRELKFKRKRKFEEAIRGESHDINQSDDEISSGLVRTIKEGVFESERTKPRYKERCRSLFGEEVTQETN